MRRSALKSANTLLQRVPYLLVVGDREVETRTVSVRTQAWCRFRQYAN